jgi:hypothetical protein
MQAAIETAAVEIATPTQPTPKRVETHFEAVTLFAKMDHRQAANDASEWK